VPSFSIKGTHAPSFDRGKKKGFFPTRKKVRLEDEGKRSVVVKREKGGNRMVATASGGITMKNRQKRKEKKKRYVPIQSGFRIDWKVWGTAKEHYRREKSGSA